MAPHATRPGVRSSASVWFASYGLSLLGKGIASVVLPLLVLDRTGDALAAGVLATVATAASAATGLVSGLLVDRIDRRVVSVVSDLLAAASLVALPVVDALWGLDMAWFLALAVVGAVIRVPGMTAQETLLPVLARLGRTGPGRLDRLIATRETVGNVLLLAGPGLGGLLVGLLGPTPVLMLVTAATSLLAALLTLVLDPRSGRIPRPDTVRGGNAVRRAVSDLLVGWTFLGRNRLVLGATLISSVLVAVLGSLQSTLMPAYFTAEDLPGLTGLTLSAIAAGSIVGSALYAASAGRIRRRTWFVVGMTGTLLGFAAVGSMASPWLVLGGAALVGLTNAPAAAVLGVLTVEATPDAMRGRVLGAQNTVMLAAPAVTSAPLAAVAATAGLPAAGAVIAVLAGVTAIAAVLVPTFRSLDDTPGGPAPDDDRAHGVDRIVQTTLP
ncbi:putative MFS family arabinose efflux permease [Pseudonocardia sediminis]|uniref:Multidrug efflux pump Tap n=1 Tax=Pseudonocardia sediminis TaxID=1397368 RepID=A0A4Q7UVQ3_PSEST|nr:MFS transporter [Pseudonocardia sediminis]RZT84931.1 putative MFS family arabinose efflux permease [Pseudonocardia sediminis]